MSTLRRTQKAVKEGIKTKRCPLFRAMRSKNPLHRIAARLRFEVKSKGLELGGKW